MSTTAYTYDPITKVYLFCDHCQIDPIDGHTLVPAHSTLESPPDEIPNGMCPRWNGSSWEVVNDYRGKQAFNGTKFVMIDFVGDLPDGWSWNPKV